MEQPNGVCLTVTSSSVDAHKVLRSTDVFVAPCAVLGHRAGISGGDLAKIAAYALAHAVQESFRNPFDISAARVRADAQQRWWDVMLVTGAACDRTVLPLRIQINRLFPDTPLHTSEQANVLHARCRTREEAHERAASLNAHLLPLRNCYFSGVVLTREE